MTFTRENLHPPKARKRFSWTTIPVWSKSCQEPTRRLVVYPSVPMPVMSTNGPLEPVQFLFILAILASFFFFALSPVITHVYQNTGTTQLVYNLFTAWVKKQNSCSVFFMLYQYPLNRRKIGAQKRCPIEPCVPPPYWNEVGSDQIVARHLSGQRSCLNLNAASPSSQGGMGAIPPSRRGVFLQQKSAVHPRSRPIPMITKVATQLTMLIF